MWRASPWHPCSSGSHQSRCEAERPGPRTLVMHPVQRWQSRDVWGMCISIPYHMSYHHLHPKSAYTIRNTFYECFIESHQLLDPAPKNGWLISPTVLHLRNMFGRQSPIPGLPGAFKPISRDQHLSVMGLLFAEATRFGWTHWDVPTPKQ